MSGTAAWYDAAAPMPGAILGRNAREAWRMLPRASLRDRLARILQETIDDAALQATFLEVSLLAGSTFSGVFA